MKETTDNYLISALITSGKNPKNKRTFVVAFENNEPASWNRQAINYTILDISNGLA